MAFTMPLHMIKCVMVMLNALNIYDTMPCSSLNLCEARDHVNIPDDGASIKKYDQIFYVGCRGNLEEQ
jgi:hypothetical protein